MSNIYELISSALKSTGYKVREQGGYQNDERLPDTHVTYQIIDSPNESHADNRPTSTTYRVQIVLYSRKPGIVQNADEILKAALIPAGFLRAGGRAYPFNAQTGHYGWTSDYKYHESEG